MNREEPAVIRSAEGRTRLLIKVALILASLLLGLASVSERLADLGSTVSGIVYLAIVVAMFACLVGVAVISNGIIRWGLAALLAVSGTVVDAFELSSGGSMTYDAFVNMMHAAGMINDALVQHRSAIVWTVIKALLLLLGLGLNPKATSRIAQKVLITAPVAGILALTAMLFTRGGDGGRALPSSFVGPSYYLLYAYEAATEDSLERKAVMLPRETASPVGHDIVLIVDESISGQYLDINHADGVRSGLRSAVPGAWIHNFGLAASIANCSVATNLTLRHGGTREAYQLYNRTMPSIFSYAKAAGLSTVLIYAQDGGARIQNGMTDAEVAQIDEIVELPQVAMLDRDQVVADAIAKRLNDSTPQFIYVNKVGCHFPVADKYPDSYMRYVPALERGSAPNISDIAMPPGWGNVVQRWQLYRNSYRNTLLWNVGTFFDRLFASASIGDSVLIYTGDHGQGLHERGDRGSTTHCSSNPQIEEGVVPLVVIHGVGTDPSQWAAAAKDNHDGMSHYRIFPTLLVMMGYVPQAVEDAYGETLLSRKPDPFTFNILFNARLGRAPVWRHIAIKEVVPPPRSDYEGR